MSTDLVCFSHLRWNFVFQRPQHLLSRAAKKLRVFFVEEPILGQDGPPRMEERRDDATGVNVVTPYLPHSLSDTAQCAIQGVLVDRLLAEHRINSYYAWFYTPMALRFVRHLRPVLSIYDCMDQLSHFKGAPRELVLLERELFKRVDVVFTGGRSLYQDKRAYHPNVHAFPSSVDVPHFSSARSSAEDPADQMGLPRPRLGYAGVIDERIDLDLLDGVASLRPDWQIIMVGPVVKIDPADLPRRPNIHYLGGKPYGDLPRYLGGWDVAILPFARNEATRFISPTKTPEYLAAGRRVVSTSIRDVVDPYGTAGLAAIADEPQSFVAAAEAALADTCHAEWLAKADTYLADLSWDRTFGAMWDVVESAVADRRSRRLLPRTAVDRVMGAQRRSGGIGVSSPVTM